MTDPWYVLALESGAAILVSWAIGTLISRGVTRVAHRARASPAVIRLLRAGVLGLWVGAAAFAVLSITGLLSQLPALTVSGLIGLAATLALQTTLQNLIAGLLLFRGQMLRLGDMIQFSGVKGRVVRIGLVTTWLKTDDGTIATVTNSNLLAGPMLNFSAQSRLEAEE